jgi:hypothetical protein
MFKKFNTTTLIIILVVLATIWAVNKFFLSEKSESTFNDEFVKIDTGLVIQVLIYPKAEKEKEIKLTKQGRSWELTNGKIKMMADSNQVRNLINSFANLKSIALAGADKSSWKDLQVEDTSGSRIKFITSDNKTYDMVVGKFGYNPATRSGSTYIRHSNEEVVYSIDGFLTFTVNQPFNSWRNKTLISGNKDSWSTLTFTYPGDSSFVLAKQNNQWMVNGAPADSAKAAQYLNGIASLQSSSFVEQYAPSSTPAYTVSIQGNNQPAPVTVVAYPADSTQKFILHSSLNNDGWFSDVPGNTVQRLFVSSRNFLK